MEFLLLWLSTIVASYFMNILNSLRIFKDAADSGYKINTKRKNELGEKLFPNSSNINFLSMMIPIFNLFKTLKNVINYNNFRFMVLDQLKMLNVLEEMSEIEQEEYGKKPTGFNAAFLPLKIEIRLAKATSIKFSEENESGEIFYEIGKSFDDITILKVTGSAAKLSIEEQKKKIIQFWTDIVLKGIEQYGNTEEFLNALKNNSNIKLNSNLKEQDNNGISKSTQGLDISGRKQMLEKFKEELLSEEKSSKESHIDNNLQFRKK